jgi:hypothetical protein
MYESTSWRFFLMLKFTKIQLTTGGGEGGERLREEKKKKTATTMKESTMP